MRGTHWMYSGARYVSADGNYGGDDIVIIENGVLTDEQWDRLGEMNDSTRIDYVRAIIDGDDVSEYED